MYHNILGRLGHTWIDDYPLNELKNLPDCYIVQVVTKDAVRDIPIAEINGTEQNIYAIKIYYQDKTKDMSPYYYSVDRKVDASILDDFRRDCDNRKRTKEMAPITNVMMSVPDEKKLRKLLKKRMLEVFRAKYESGAEYAGDDFIFHRNQYKPTGLRKMLEFVRQADEYGIDIVISFDIENATADQMERTLNDLEMIDATVENERLP